MEWSHNESSISERWILGVTSLRSRCVVVLILVPVAVAVIMRTDRCVPRCPLVRGEHLNRGRYVRGWAFIPRSVPSNGHAAETTKLPLPRSILRRCFINSQGRPLAPVALLTTPVPKPPMPGGSLVFCARFASFQSPVSIRSRTRSFLIDCVSASASFLAIPPRRARVTQASRIHAV